MHKKSSPSKWVYGGVVVLLVSGLGHVWKMCTSTPVQKSLYAKKCPAPVPCLCERHPGSPVSNNTPQESVQAQPNVSYWVNGARQGDTAVLAEACMLSGPELTQYSSAASMKRLCDLPVNKRVKNIGIEPLSQACQEQDGDSCTLLALYFGWQDVQKSRAFAEQACSAGKASGCAILSRIDHMPSLAEKACDAGRDEAGSGSWGCHATAHTYESPSNSNRDLNKALLYKAKACYRGIRSPMAYNRTQAEFACAELMETIQKAEFQLNPSYPPR